jgi:hypothetical protein
MQDICLTCKEEERKHPKYDEARQRELEEIKRGNYNFEGIGWDALTYEERIAWFVNEFYETHMEYQSLLVTMKDQDLDNIIKWYDDTIKIPKYRHEI